MKLRIAALISLLVLIVLSSACSSGISKEEYSALDKKYNDLQQQYKQLKTENDVAEAKVKEYADRLNVASTWAVFYDIYADIYRYESGQPTKYGYAGNKVSQKFIDEFVTLAKEAGGAEFAETVRQAFFLPLGKEKDKAWATFHTKLAEALINATLP